MSRALVIITHGETRGQHRNAALVQLTASLMNQPALAGQGISSVHCGVLSGQPSVAAALQKAHDSNAGEIIIYPLFMSTGYFVQTALPGQIKEASPALPITTLPPLGNDPALPALLYQKGLETLDRTGWQIADTRLLVVGHGSTKSPAPARATRYQAKILLPTSHFMTIETAFLEEKPLFEPLLKKTGTQPTIIAGYFTGSGLHGGYDISAAIQKTGAKAVYSGPVGAAIEVKELILAAIARHGLQ